MVDLQQECVELLLERVERYLSTNVRDLSAVTLQKKADSAEKSGPSWDPAKVSHIYVICS